MSATPSDIQTRLVALYALISGIVTVTDDWPRDNKPFAASELPAVIIQYGRATNIRQSGKNFIMTRPFYAILLSARIKDDVKIPDRASLETVEPFLISVPAFFMARPLLELNGGDGIATPPGSLPSDSAAGRFVFRGATYIRTVFTHEITTRHSA